MSTIAQLNVLLSTDTRSLTSGLRQAGNRTRSFAKGAKRQMGEVATSFRATMNRVVNLRTAIGVLAGSAGIGLLVRNNLQAIDSLGKFANTIGDSTENVQAMRRQAELAGIGVGTMDSALQRATRRAAQAADDTGAAADAYERLGLSAREVANMAPTEAFWAQADAISQLTSRSEQLRAANELFGREAEDVIRIIDSGRGSFESTRKEMERTGEAISNIDATRVALANDAITEMRGSLSAMGQQFTIELAPVITAVARRIRVMSEESDGFGLASLDAAEMVVSSLGWIVDSAEGVRRTFGLLGRGIAVTMHGIQVLILATTDMILTGPMDAINAFIDQVNRVPGVEIKPLEMAGFQRSIRNELNLARGAVGAGLDDIQDLLLKPMPRAAALDMIQSIRKEADDLVSSRGDVAVPGIATGGDPGETPEAAAARAEQYANRLESLRAHLYTEEEAERLSHQKRIDDLTELREQGFIQDQVHRELKESLEADHQDRLNAIVQRGLSDREKFEQASYASQAKTIFGAMENITAGIAQHSRAAFEINKIATLANIALNTHEAVTSAYKWGAAFGGPAAGAAAGAAAFAAQAVQADAANSTQFNGGGRGSAPSIAGTTPAPAVTPVSEQQPERPQSQELLVRGTGDQPLTADDLIEALNERLADGLQLSGIRRT